MPNTYTLIASNTLSSSVGSVTFSSIPETYTDLVLRWSARLSGGTNGAQVEIRPNGVTSGYSDTYIEKDAANTVSSSRESTANGNSGIYVGAANGSTTTSSTFSSSEIYIPNYANTSYRKCLSATTFTLQNTASATFISAVAGLNNSTSAITSLEIATRAFSFVSGSSFFLYGIKNS